MYLPRALSVTANMDLDLDHVNVWGELRGRVKPLDSIAVIFCL